MFNLFNKKNKNSLLNEAKEELIILNTEMKDSILYSRIQNILLGLIKNNPEKIIEQIIQTEEENSKAWAIESVAFCAQRFLESGQFHVYRGVLNIEGDELLKIYNLMYDKLLKMNISYITAEYVEECNKYIREEIKKIG